MIRTITVQGYKSFHAATPVAIPIETATQKPVFFYGLNGAGKTAIGEVIHGHSVGDPAFNACKVVTTDGGPFRYLVYNHHFVHSVIGEAAGMPGIFTIGEVDTETQRKIEENERLLQEVRLAHEVAQRDADSLTRQLDAALKDAKEEVWKVYQAQDGKEFDAFLTGYGRDKQKFFDDLRKFETLDEEELEGLPGLVKRLQDISGAETSKVKHQLPLDSFLAIEKAPIWKERIEVSGESRLAPLVEELGSGDWVSKGRGYVHNDQCPFCQQGLPSDFLAELARLLDGDRQEKIDAIDTHTAAYESAIQALEKAVEVALAEPLSAEAELSATWEVVHAVLKANLATMRLKQATPSEPAEITETGLQPMKDALLALNTRIGDFNMRVQNKASERAAIRALFWKNLCSRLC